MKAKQRSYKIKSILVNGVKVSQVVIDAHYEEKHSSYMSDDLILDLVQQLDGRYEVAEAKSGPFSYFATLIEEERRQYRLIWLLEDGSIYIGVVNAYRDQRGS